jgi:hypothetical protein
MDAENKMKTCPPCRRLGREGGVPPRRDNWSMARACVFCGGTPVTAEHIWPRWAQKYLLSRDPQEHTRTIRQAGRDPRRNVYPMRPFDAKAKIVCGDCNTGWMSRLEQRAQPPLIDLMGGSSWQLGRSEQQLLAAWGLKTILVLDASFACRTGVTTEQRRYLARTGAPPTGGVLLWIAPYDGAQPGQFHENGMALGGPDAIADDTDEPNLWTATLTFGSLAFHAAGCADPRTFRVEGVTYGDLRLRRIWPYKEPIGWRPAPAFSDPEIAALTTTLYETLLEHVGSVAPASAALSRGPRALAARRRPSPQAGPH